MSSAFSPAYSTGQSPLDALGSLLRGHPQRREIERTIVSLLEISRSSTDASEWRLIRGALADIRDGLAVFGPRRQTRKVTVFGSARTATEDPAYKLAEQLAAEAVAQGFDVMTGAGGGIMEAANRGAGCENSIGLNVDLPFEQHANRYVSGCDGRLLHFRYFFTRKLFFLRESDALVVLPGGYGTFDELFESLTLIQTGRTPPIPLVMLAPPGDDFWPTLMRDVQAGLAARGLISAEDTALLKQATTAAEAMEHICTFYRVFHGAQLGEDRMELLLHVPIPPDLLPDLNREFADVVSEGTISAGESSDEEGILRPCLRFQLDRRRMGRLYQLIDRINAIPLPASPALEQPCQRLGVSAA
ncbi:TIGR00730 family Rossman fold protein [Synechococcus sp. GreenBA-s]|nr:TIGR00730 family Rossman fold protein [Synechococcus sp. GreenBA-s]